ncbi:MAG: hypothetical protein ACRD15_05215 [Vicinamibacterales bacterium]
MKRSKRGDTGATVDWRRSWAVAVEAPQSARAEDLRARLDEIAGGIPDSEALEIEREMLEGLDALVELTAAIANGGPPAIPTGHRVVGGDRCHFSAPASLPDDPAQPSGTLLLTGTRMVFVGGARAVTVPWHSVAECVRQDRDVLLVRLDRPDVHRVRCNTFADALCAARLVRHFAPRRRL